MKHDEKILVLVTFVLVSIVLLYREPCEIAYKEYSETPKLRPIKLKNSNHTQLLLSNPYYSKGEFTNSLMLNNVYCEPTFNYIVDEGRVYSVNKTVGGDEFYMVALDKGNNVVATALIEDRFDGSYTYKWFPLTTAHFCTIKITQQYTCGKGQLTPPLKDTWKNSGVTRLESSFEVEGFVKMKRFRQTLNSTNMVAFGDSLMEQFVNDRVPFLKCQAALSTNTLHSVFIPSIDKLIADNKNANKILLNSGVWDVLESNAEQRYVGFTDHIQALTFLLQHLNTKYPSMDILWKSMTGMHVHNVDCDAVDTSCYVINCKLACWDRIRYMSTSRAYLLHTLQKHTISRLFPNITVLDMYDITYANAHNTKTGDGRHYTKEFNDKLWNEFF